MASFIKFLFLAKNLSSFFFVISNKKVSSIKFGKLLYIKTKFSYILKNDGKLKFYRLHPVYLLGDYCSRRKITAPTYELRFKCGPDHKNNFLFKVVEFHKSLSLIQNELIKLYYSYRS